MLEYLEKHHDLVTAATALAALVVSLMSIVLTVWNMIAQRSHNRKSVLPIGQLTEGDYEDRIFVGVRNSGIGPMLIDKILVKKQGANAETRLAIIDFMPPLPDGILWSTFMTDMSGSAVPADKERTLISLEGDPRDEKFC